MISLTMEYKHLGRESINFKKEVNIAMRKLLITLLVVASVVTLTGCKRVFHPEVVERSESLCDSFGGNKTKGFTYTVMKTEPPIYRVFRSCFDGTTVEKSFKVETH